MSNADQEIKLTNSSTKSKDSQGFRTALFIEVPDFEIKSIAEGVENLKLNLNNEQMTPKTPHMSSENFKNCISADLFKRLEESSPIKSQLSQRRISDIGVVSCKEIEEESSQIDDYEKEENNEDEKILNLKNFSQTKNFKLKTQLINKNEDDDDYNKFDSQVYDNNPFSPNELDGKFKLLKKDSSPIYNYYDGTTEYLSQSYLNEYGRNEDNYNFLKKNESPILKNDYNMGYINNMYSPMINNNMSKINNTGINMGNLIKHNNINNAHYPSFIPFPDTNEYFNSSNNFNYCNEGYDCNNSYTDINNSCKKSSNYDGTGSNSTKKSSDESYIVEMFGKRGWICESCNNFNYETRVKCNRCGLNKSPKKNVKKVKKVEKVALNQSVDDDEKKKKKPFQERVGDWVCIKCKNLNFSFRVICNRCQLPKMESEKMFDQYMSNLMNYVKLNEMVQKQQIMMNQKTPNKYGLINNSSININNNFFNNYSNKGIDQNQFQSTYFNQMMGNKYKES